MILAGELWQNETGRRRLAGEDWHRRRLAGGDW
jgi:hypothetical protein